MALFRRPKKTARPRVITINPDEEDDQMDDLPAPAEVSKVSSNNGHSSSEIKSEKLSSKPKKEKDAAAMDPFSKKQTLLSFDEEFEGDDGEVFKVKKSSVSRRLIKQRGKEKKSESSSSFSFKGSQKMDLGAMGSKLKVEKESEPPSPTVTVKLKESSSSEFKLRILNGREAEAVNMEEEDNDEEEEEEMELSVQFRSTAQRDAASEAVRIALEKGQIPDSNLIHEARKRRQLARETGSAAPVEFIPVDNTSKYRGEKSRIIRDDDNDRSGDEDDEERLNFSTATNAAQIDRDKRREAFDAAQDEERDRYSAGDSDPEMDEWERQQLRKGVTQSQMQSVAKELFQQQPYIYSNDNQPNIYTAGSYYDASSYSSSYTSSSQVPSIDSPLAINNKSRQDLTTKNNRVLNVDEIITGNKKLTPEMVLKVLGERLDKLKLSKESHEGALSRMEADLDLADKELTDASNSKPALSSRFVLYQNLRGYVTDLVDCLRTKVPVIESLENSMLELMKNKTDRLAERRRQDTKDQLEEVKAALTIMGGNPVTVPPPAVGEAKTRRAAEREGRRTRRRRLREMKDLKGHKEGLSSDDEEMESELSTLKGQKVAIVREAQRVFDDVVEDFGTLDGILARFAEWRQHDLSTYKESYAYMCVPKCLAPLLRAYLLCWDPFEDGFNMLKFQWMKPLASFGCGKNESIEVLGSDPDSRLIPEVAEKILVPWITRVVKAKWDPTSASQTKKLVNVTRRCIDEWSVNPTSKTIQSLMTAIVTKFKDAVDTDIYIPLFPKTVMTNKCSPAYLFAARQFWSSVKLLDNMSSWAGLLSEKPLHILALDALLTRYILLGLRTAPDLNESVERAKGVVNVLPRTWLSRDSNTEVPNGLQQLTSCLVSIVQNVDFALAINRLAIPEIVNVLKSIGSLDEAQLVSQKYS